MKKFISLLGRNFGFFLFTLSVGLIYSANSVVIPSVSGELINSAVSDPSSVSATLAAFFAVNVLQVCLSQLDEYAGNTLKLRQKSLMRKNAFRAFLRRSGAAREERSAFVSFVNNDIPDAAEQYVLGTVDIIKCVSIILFSAVSLLSVHWLLAVVIVGVSALVVLLPNAFRKKGALARQDYSAALARYNAALSSVLGGLAVVKAYRCAYFVTGTADEADSGVAKSEAALMSRQLTVHRVTTALQIAKTVLVLVLGVALISRGEINVGELVTAISLSGMISSPIEVLAYLRHGRNEAAPIIARYREMLGRGDGTGGCSVGGDRTLTLTKLGCSAGELEILKDVTVTFSPGGKYLITGESGSGKSTLLRLLSRTDGEDYSGSVSLGGTEIRDIAPDSYYGCVCPVFQEPYLFFATLRDNILVGRDISEETLKETAERLNISYLLDRYGRNELSPELMETLSGGEKQRVALARAMVGAPDIYLLDETTSALDAANAEAVERLMLETDATVINVSHKANPKLSGLYDAEYELRDGKLIRK